MIPMDRSFYLECAKRSRNRKFILMCARNFARVLNKNALAALTAEGAQR